MKLSKPQLEQIIKEEVQRCVTETTTVYKSPTEGLEPAGIVLYHMGKALTELSISKIYPEIEERLDVLFKELRDDLNAIGAERRRQSLESGGKSHENFE